MKRLAFKALAAVVMVAASGAIATARADESVGAGGGAAGGQGSTTDAVRSPATTTEGALDASAAEKTRCIGAHASAQRALLARHIADARASARACAADSCPAVLRAECTELASRADAAAPTLTVAVRDGRGVDVSGTRVFVDERELARPTDAEVEPGARRIRVTTADGRERSIEVVVQVGEKNRVITIELQDVTAPSSRAVVVDTVPTRSAPPSSAARALPWILTATSVTALGLGTGFGLNGLSRQRDLERTCVPACNSDAVAQMRTSYVIADVAWIVGAVTGVAAIYTWVR